MAPESRGFFTCVDTRMCLRERTAGGQSAPGPQVLRGLITPNAPRSRGHDKVNQHYFSKAKF